MTKEKEKQEAAEMNVSQNINDETEDFNLKNAKRLWGNAERFQGISKYYAEFLSLLHFQFYWRDRERDKKHNILDKTTRICLQGK